MQEQPKNSGTVPVTCLDLADLPETERFGFWKESISVLFDVSLAPDANRADFTSRLTTCHLGSLMLSRTQSPSQSFKRASRLIARDGIDHFLVQIFQQGRNPGQCGKIHFNVRPGDVLLLDLAQPLETRTDNQDSLTLVVPRRVLEQHLKSPERFHGRVLPRESLLGRLLGEHLRALWDATPTASADEANAMAEGLAGLVGAYFGRIALPDGAPDIDAALGLTLRRYIVEHLGDRALGPDLLLASFQISRARLFRIFAPCGGVLRYIQAQRLARCRAELLQPAHRHRRIAEIAGAAGFPDETHFSRAFRQAFGLSPREWRAGVAPALAAAPAASGPADRRYEEWLRNLG